MMYTRRNWVALVSILGLTGKRSSAGAEVADSGTDEVAADDTKQDKKRSAGSDSKSGKASQSKSDKLKLNQQTLRNQNRPRQQNGEPGGSRDCPPPEEPMSKVHCTAATKAKRHPALTKAKKT